MARDHADPLAKAEAKGKNTYIDKMQDPSRFRITDPELGQKLAGKFVVLVDDFITSGETLDGWIEALASIGIKADGVAAIGALDGAKAINPNQLEGLARKLGKMLKESPKKILEDLRLAHSHSRSTLIRKADEDATRHPQKVRELIARKAELVRRTLGTGEKSASDRNLLGPPGSGGSGDI